VFAIPARWAAARDRLNPQTPFNLVSTNDIIGGNSGSPLIDERGDLVGLIFDGNRYSFVWSTVYEGRRGRAVSVDVRAMVEVLREVYGAKALVEELTAAR
jgi:S1-C subfamily serine protease